MWWIEAKERVLAVSVGEEGKTQNNVRGDNYLSTMLAYCREQVAQIAPLSRTADTSADVVDPSGTLRAVRRAASAASSLLDELWRDSDRTEGRVMLYHYDAAVGANANCADASSLVNTSGGELEEVMEGEVVVEPGSGDGGTLGDEEAALGTGRERRF